MGNRKELGNWMSSGKGLGCSISDWAGPNTLKSSSLGMDFTVGREVEETASAKVLGLGHAWHIQGTRKCD